MEKNKYKGILVLLIVLSTLFVSISMVCAEDVPDPGNQTVTNETSNTDNSNTSVNIPKKPTKVSQTNVIKAAKSLQSYATKNKKLPNYVTVAGYKFSIPEFYYLMSKTISNKNKKINSAIVVKYNIKNPSKASGTWVKGKIYSYYYSIYADKIIKYMNTYKKVPNYLVTAGGSKLQYQSNVYLFAKALAGASKKLPYYVSFNVKAANPINKYLPSYNRDKPNVQLLGSGNLGYVQLLGPYGNTSSKIKIAYIIGMHPLESNAHTALYKTLTTSKNLKYLYYIYKITVTKDADKYNSGRMNGQLIAQKYIVPNIKLNKYNLVIDIHSNRDKSEGGGYEKSNFIFAPLDKGSSKTIAYKLKSQIPGLSYYYPQSQTSPPYCTEPIVRSGIKTLVYETGSPNFEPMTTTLNYIKQLIAKVDRLVL
ncbi:hypothetical protein KQY27_06100 [Methanobrevibacter sp. TMH8]|uniref:hypothetical protein n=1 Tax=Methanobrevibacter sp. TMH8 TaxID=2848611 RepID=UPI001CC99945|nr:hypothetical protein [Methanobrevibacter sp. TMH8]MBZ9571109.1 hypothetical protein [Methanobrevibacter sp. TMH8]